MRSVSETSTSFESDGKLQVEETRLEETRTKVKIRLR